LLFKTKNRDRSEEKRDEEHVRSARNHGEKRRTLKIGSVYHFRNNIYIHLRAEERIYTYKGGEEYTKNLKEIQ
jgi:hypothetical protein